MGVSNQYHCGDPKCQKQVEENLENIKGIKRTLFGAEGSTGLIKLINDMVPKKWVWVAVVAIAIPTFGTAIRVWYATESATLMYATKEEAHDHDRRLDKVEQHIDSILSTMKRIENKQDAILENMHNSPDL